MLRQQWKKANQLIAQYNAKLKDIEKERAEILNAARWDASENSKVIIEEAKREAEAIIKRARERVAADQQRLKEETRRHIIELAALIAEKYITANIGEQEQNQIFEETLAQDGGNKMAKLKARYVDALLELAEENANLEQDLEQALLLRDSLSDQDVLKFLMHPHVPDQDKQQLFAEVFADKLAEYLLGFYI